MNDTVKFVAKHDVLAGEFVVISSKGVTDKNDNPVIQYKGNELYDLSSIGEWFSESATNIAANYKIDGKKVQILDIKIMTASNGALPHDTLTAVVPMAQDVVSTINSADRFAWYDVTAKIGEITVSTSEAYGLGLKDDADLPFSGWLCWDDYNDASGAARCGAPYVAYRVGSSKIATHMVRALEPVYMAKRARISCKKDNKPADFDGIGPDFKLALDYIVENYKIDGHKIKIQNIKVMTAGDDAKPCDSLMATKPIVCEVISAEDDASAVRKALVFVFGLSAEIERKKMASQKTKEGLARVRAEGKVLGRPLGSSNSSLKLTGKEQIIQELLAQGCSKVKIAEQLNVNRRTLYAFINQRKK